LRSYADIVAAYIRDHRPNANRLLQFFRDCPALEGAIEYAARCKLPSGKRHPHQYRIPAAALAEAARRLRNSAAELSQCRSFAKLYALVQDRIGGVRGIGVLTAYDVANHLGAHLKRAPKVVYLHAGTARGAKALGLGHRDGTLDPAELPAPFRRLRPREVEDCLCLYQDELKALAAQPSAGTRPLRHLEGPHPRVGT
jgi:hypothetical protein